MNRGLIIVISLFFVSLITKAQKCETFDRKLMNFLPSYVPDTINCIDEHGLKQGWWIYYKVDYNPVAIPDELDSGYYVADYIYGQYNSGFKTGAWIKFKNVHQCYIAEIDSYYYNKDTVRVTSYNIMGKETNTIEFIDDSSIVNYVTCLTKDTSDILYITCNRNVQLSQNACHVYFRNKLKKIIPYAEFEEKYKPQFLADKYDKKN